MQAIQNFIANPAVQDGAIKATKVLTAATLAGVIGALFNKVVTRHSEEGCTSSYKRPFAFAFAAVATFQVARIAASSVPAISNVASTVANQQYVSTAWKFITTI